MAVHLVLLGSLALLASAVSGGWAGPPQRTAHIRHLSHSHHTLPLLTMTTEPTDDGADGTEDAPNAFEDAMRKLTGDEEYRFGDLTKKTVAAGEDAIKGTLSELTGKVVFSLTRTPFVPYVTRPFFLYITCQSVFVLFLQRTPTCTNSATSQRWRSPLSRGKRSTILGKFPSTPFPHMWRPHFSHMSEVEFFLSLQRHLT